MPESTDSHPFFVGVAFQRSRGYDIGMSYILKSVVKMRPQYAGILRSLSVAKRNKYFSELVTRYPLNLDKGQSERSDVSGVDTAIDVTIDVAADIWSVLSKTNPNVLSQYLARKIDKHPPMPPKPGNPPAAEPSSGGSACPTSVDDDGHGD